MTLIQIGRRRCDANCYTAKHARCRCICESRNHMAGLAQASRNTLDSAQALVRAHGESHIKIRAQEQMILFPMAIL